MSGPVPIQPAPMPLQATQAVPLSQLMPIPASIISLPAAPYLNVLSRPLSINGEVISLLESGKATLRANAGLFELAINKADAALFQTFKTAIEAGGNAKLTIDFLLKPGAPPREVILFVPAPDQPRRETKTATTTAPVITGGQEPKASKGPVVDVALMPEGIDEEAVLDPRSLGKAMARQNQSDPLTALPRFIERIRGAIPEKAALLVQKTTTDQLDALLSSPDKTNPTAPLPQASKSATSGVQVMQWRLDNILPPDADIPDLSVDQIKARVVGQTLGGQTLAKSENGQTHLIRHTSPLPAQSLLIATPLAPEEPMILARHARTDQALVDATESLLATLNHMDPAAASRFTSTHIPNAQGNMTGTLLFLLTALHGGTFEEWMGQPTLMRLDMIQKKRVAEALTQSLQDGARPAQDDLAGEWKSWSLPVLNGAVVDTLRLYVRQDHERARSHSQRNDKPVYTRFVISMNLSHLGAMQLDGLSQIKKLDLIVRSEKPLPTNLTHELRETTRGVFDSIGMTGSLLFQTGRENWLSFKEPPVGVTA